MELVWKPIQTFYSLFDPFLPRVENQEKQAAEDKRRLRNFEFCGGWNEQNGCLDPDSDVVGSRRPSSRHRQRWPRRSSWDKQHQNTQVSSKSKSLSAEADCKYRTCDGTLELDDNQQLLRRGQELAHLRLWRTQMVPRCLLRSTDERATGCDRHVTSTCCGKSVLT